LNTEIVVSYSI